eukprot:TRINITY_DN1221_c0_g1_i3.p1 TRINITY_DN1221_c0_g1~~TRINITY_DN1221_c0_g1_i3.p1  ORF type:complete len:352 (+),score=66.64 TRINITY_DN1221_c0_g1_i3:169-1224(+)
MNAYSLCQSSDYSHTNSVIKQYRNNVSKDSMKFQSWRKANLDLENIDKAKHNMHDCSRSQKTSRTLSIILLECTIEYKRSLIETFRKSLEQAKEDYKYMLEEQQQLQQTLQFEQEASSKEQHFLHNAIVQIEASLKQENKRLAQMGEDYELAKKQKTKLYQEASAALTAVLKEMDELEQDKQLLEDEHAQTRNIVFLSRAIEPLERAEKEIEEHKEELEKSVGAVKALVREKEEERGMLVEDLSMHLFQRAEYVMQHEELSYLYGQLTESVFEEYIAYIKSLSSPKRSKIYLTISRTQLRKLQSKIILYQSYTKHRCIFFVSITNIQQSYSRNITWRYRHPQNIQHSLQRS